MRRIALTLLLSILYAGLPSHAEFLFAPTDPTANGFFTPTINYVEGEYEYSSWDIFYAPKGAPNYPDVFAPAGGVWDPSTQSWKPEQRSSAGFPANPNYNPSDAYAFWDAYNPTITQTRSNTAFIIGPDVSGNIYTFQDKTAYQLHNAPDYVDVGSQLGTVIFQFQTDGTNVDFANIRLGYKAQDGNTYYLGINDSETEYLREYSTTGSDHWSATAGYRNRVLLQWDLSAIAGTGEYWIEWESLSSSMSFQKADLLTASYFEVGMPASSTWTGGTGEWDDSTYWSGQGGSVPLENGNLKFKNSTPAEVDINDSDHAVGEIIFDHASDVTLSSSGGHRLIANTGVTTRNGATDAVYTFDADYTFGALNFFEINTGTVAMNGTISGPYGMVKLGAGTLELNADNTFSGFLAVQDGTLVLNGSNAYTGSTNVVNGRVIVANENAFGNGTSALGIGGDADLYAFTTGVHSWMAELLIQGDLTLNRNITLGAGDLGKRLGAFDTIDGAEFSGTLSFSGVVSNPDAPGGASAVGNTRLTAQSDTDTLIFSGAMVGGSTSKTVTVDGSGTVIYTGMDKTYNTSTVVASGSLLIDAGTAYTGNGNWAVHTGATLQVDGTLDGSGELYLDSGTLTGSGVISRAFTVADSTILSPGNSPGILETSSQTWGEGGIYLWEISSVLGDAGTTWDLIRITGNLTLESTRHSPFEILLTSLDTEQAMGILADFDELIDYTWVIATTSEGITGFDEKTFFVDSGAFANAFTGTFNVATSGNDLLLTYTAIPEPAIGLLFILGMLLLAIRHRNATQVFRNRKAASSSLS